MTDSEQVRGAGKYGDHDLISDSQTSMARRALFWLISGGLIAGVWLLVRSEMYFSAVAVAFCFIVLITLKLTARYRSDLQRDISEKGRSDVDFILASSDAGAGTDDDRLALKSPYRQTTLVSEEALLSTLTQIRSDLENAVSESDSSDSGSGELSGLQSDSSRVSPTNESCDSIVTVSRKIHHLMDTHYQRFRASATQR